MNRYAVLCLDNNPISAEQFRLELSAFSSKFDILSVESIEEALISDYLTPTFGNEALRYALLIVIPTAGIWSTFHFILASKRMETG